MELIDRIVIAEDSIKANLKRTICNKCGRHYFMAVSSDGSVMQPCPACLGLFPDEKQAQRKAYLRR